MNVIMKAVSEGRRSAVSARREAEECLEAAKLEFRLNE
jgi:hypothetical protein